MRVTNTGIDNDLGAKVSMQGIHQQETGDVVARLS